MKPTYFSRTVIASSLVAGLLAGTLWGAATARAADVLAADVLAGDIPAADPLFSPQAGIGVTLAPATLMRVGQVAANSPSAKAGVQAGSFLLSVDQHKVTSSDELRASMAKVGPGTPVEMQFADYDQETHSYKLRSVTVEGAGADEANPANRGRVGITFQPTDVLAVNTILPGSPVANQGMHKGDVLLSLNKYELLSSTDLRTSMFMVKPGEKVAVAFIGTGADGQSLEVHQVTVETIVRFAPLIAPTPQTLRLADLAGHAERWPSLVSLTRDVPLPSGETATAGQQFRVTAFADATQNLTLEDNLKSISVAPDSSDFLPRANAAWAALTPTQRAVDSGVLLAEMSLWPSQVTALRLLKNTNGMAVNAGEKLELVSVLPSGKLWLFTPKTNTIIADITETDALPLARQRALLAPEKRPSRLADALREVLVDANGQPTKPARLDDSRLFVCYYGAAWSDATRTFTPKLIQFFNRVAPTNPRLSMTFIDSDPKPEQMLAYMKEAQMPWPAVPLAAMRNSGVLGQYHIIPLPRLVVLDRNGSLLVDSREKGLDDSLQILSNLLLAGAGP